MCATWINGARDNKVFIIRVEIRHIDNKMIVKQCRLDTNFPRCRFFGANRKIVASPRAYDLVAVGIQ